MKNKRIKIILFSTALILLVPLVAMLFTNEVNWTLLDFIIAGVLLLGTGFWSEWILRKTSKIKYRIVWITAIILLLLLVWAELAVGIFDSFFGGN